MVNRHLERDFGTDLTTLLRGWYQPRAGGMATTEDFLAYLIEATDDATTWQRLFEDWVYVGPAPTLEVSDYSFEAGQIAVTVTRTGGADQDLSALQVAFSGGGGVVTEAAPLPSGTKSVIVSASAAQAPDEIAIDADGLYIFRLRTASGFAGPAVTRGR